MASNCKVICLHKSKADRECISMEHLNVFSFDHQPENDKICLTAIWTCITDLQAYIVYVK